MNPEQDLPGLFQRLSRISALVGLVAAVPTIAAALLQPALFYPAYLVGFLFWWNITLGCLALSCLHHLTGGGWGVAIRRTLDATTGMFPWLAVLFVPLLFGLEILYPWARPEIVAADPGLQHRAPYLNVTFFTIRAVIYFVIWILIDRQVSRRVSSPVLARDQRTLDRLQLSGAVGVIFWGLTVTFASIDWTMSLDPHWMSSVHGVLVMAGQAVAGLAFSILTLVWLRDYRSFAQLIDLQRIHDLGNLLLAFTLFWTYVSYTQFVVIWAGNLPEETSWYLHRAQNYWPVVAVILAIFHFLVPLGLLLNRTVKRTPVFIAAVAGMLLAMRLLECDWQVMPAFVASPINGNWVILFTPVTIGGFWLAILMRRMSLDLRLPVFDPYPREEVRDDYLNQPAH